MPVGTSEVAIALVVTFLGALAQGVVGIGFGVLSVPVLSLVNPVLAPVPQLLMALPLTVMMSWRERTHADLRGVTWVLVGRAPGAAAGLLLLALATQRTLDVVIAAVVLSGVAIRATGITVVRTPVRDVLVGAFAGTASMVASIGGPPMALLYQDESGPTIRASLSMVFTIGLLITLAGRFLSGLIAAADVRIAIALLPAMLAGYAMSVVVADKVAAPAMRIGILTLSAFAACGLLLRAI